MSSNYPSGFASGVTIRGVPLQQAHPGEVFWVNNSSVLAKGGIGGSDGNDGSYRKPFSTIDGAIGKCTAGRGDILMVMPGHSETVITDGGIACDVAGVAIIGLGTGSLRPNIILDTAAAAALTVSAANVSLSNLLFTASFADVANAIDVTAANLTIASCEFEEEGANLNFADIISATGADNTADGLHVEGCVSTAIDTGIDSFILSANTIDRLVVKDNMVSHQHANALALVECATGGALTDALIEGNKFATLDAAGAVAIVTDTTTGTNGFVVGNTLSSRDEAGELVATAATHFTFSENYSASVVDTSGYILPAVDS